jgi:two-component system chemotaxis response regulator CheB
MRNEKIKVLIVDDSALMRRIIQNILVQDPDIEIAGTARDGKEALKMAAELNPDIITLDVEMPVMDGISCIEHLLKQGQYGIIMISSFTKERANETIRALEQGAFDFITKSGNIFDMSSQGKQKEIIDKIKLAYRTLKNNQLFNAVKRKKPIENADSAVIPQELKYVIAVGVSTGGPRALSEILPEFPGDLPAAIVIVQHMPPGFTASLAARLNEICKLSVKEAEDGDEIKPGHAYLAPGDYHMTFSSEGRKLKVRLLKTPPVGGLRPNVDVMMESLSETGFEPIIGVIMTGMGNDGTKGLIKLKEKKNAFIVAQDESTSIVFGMPRSAIDNGVVDKTVPLQEIPTCIMKFMGVHG